jgi:hypothetical protein
MVSMQHKIVKSVPHTSTSPQVGQEARTLAVLTSIRSAAAAGF